MRLINKLEALTVLTVIAPIHIIDLEICFAETSHKRYVPEDSLYPRTRYLDLDPSSQVVAGNGYVFDIHLLGFVPI